MVMSAFILYKLKYLWYKCKIHELLAFLGITQMFCCINHCL